MRSIVTSRPNQKPDPTTGNLPVEWHQDRYFDVGLCDRALEAGIGSDEEVAGGQGLQVLVQEANHDVKLQNDQIDNMVSQGVKGLIIVAEDGDAAATAVRQGRSKAGVKVIAYDRLIKIAGHRGVSVVRQRRKWAGNKPMV